MVLLALSAFYVGTHRSALPPGRVLSPADQLERFAPYGQAEAHEIRNHLLLDPLLQFEPWLAFTRRELSQGRLPVWNPDQGLGVAHLGNDQSAVFSPLSLPYYLFGPNPGLFLVGLLKTLLLGGGVFLFLRQRGVGRRGSLFAGLAGAGAGPVTAWQLHPHTAAFAWVGLLLWSADRALGQGGRGRREVWSGALALALCTAGCLCGGHAQSALFAALACAALVVSEAAAQARARGLESAARAALPAAVGAGLGVLLAAPHLLPFVDALRASTEFGSRLAGGITGQAPLRLLPLSLFPDLLGNPRDTIYPAPFLPSGFLEFAPAYAGALTLACGLLGLARSHPRRRLGLVLASWTVLALLVVFSPVCELAKVALPGVRVHRLGFLAALGIALLGGVGFDALTRTEWRPPLWSLLVPLACAGVICAALDPFPGWRVDAVARPGRGPTLALLVPLLATTGGLWALRGSRGLREVALAGLLALELFAFASDFAPGVPAEAAQPEPAGLRGLEGRVFAVGKRVLGPNRGLAHGLRCVRSYDALGNRYVQETFDALAPFEGPMMGALGFDDAVADRLGIRWVISDDPNLRANLRRGLSNWLPGSQGYGGPHVPLPAGGVQQSARVPACDVVSLPEVSSRGPTRFRLRISGPAGERASECFLPGAGRGALAFRFEPPLESGQVTLRLESDPPGASAIYSARPELGRLRVGDQQGPGSLTLLYARQLSAPYREHPRPWRGAWLLENPDPAPLVEVLAGEGGARLLPRERPDTLELELEGGELRLCVAEAFSPGWRAELAGRALPVGSRGGLLELEVPGSGPRRVRLRFEPPSLRLGFGLAGLALALWLGLALWAGRGQLH